MKVKRSLSLKWNVSLFRGALHWDGSEGKKLGREHFYLWTIIIREGIELQYRKSPLPPSEGILSSLSPHPPTSHPPLKNLRVCHPCCTFSMQHITKIFPLMVISGSFELLSTKLTQKEVRPQSVKVVGPLSYRLICYENNFPNTTSPKKNFSPNPYKGAGNKLATAPKSQWSLVPTDSSPIHILREKEEKKSM